MAAFRNKRSLLGELVRTAVRGGDPSPVIASPDLHELLTRGRGWTRERYCDWLAESLEALLQ